MRISEAIDHWNLTNKKEKKFKKMTQRKLAVMVIKDRDISDNSKSQLFAQFNNGKPCPHHYVKRIATLTGVTSDFLLGLTDHSTVTDRISDMIDRVESTIKTKTKKS